MKTKMNDEEHLIGLPFLQRTRTRIRQSAEHILYFTKEIGAPDEYHDELEKLETAGPDDEVTIIINSPGGRLDAGTMLITAIETCPATTTAHVFEAASMATGLALACDNWVIGDFTTFMIHEPSYLSLGKHHEISQHSDFMAKYVDMVMKRMYTGFLTPKELEKVCNGSDMWMLAEEIAERLAKYSEHREKEEEKAAKAHQRQMKQIWREMNAQAKRGEKAD